MIDILVIFACGYLILYYFCGQGRILSEVLILLSTLCMIFVYKFQFWGTVLNEFGVQVTTLCMNFGVHILYCTCRSGKHNVTDSTVQYSPYSGQDVDSKWTVLMVELA